MKQAFKQFEVCIRYCVSVPNDGLAKDLQEILQRKVAGAAALATLETNAASTAPVITVTEHQQ